MKQSAPLEIGIPVIDLDRMVAFYRDVFSCEELRRAEIPPELSRAIQVTSAGYTNVWLQFPGGEVVKLVRPTVPAEPRHPPAYAAATTGIAYFTLYCDDIAEAIAKAEGCGAQLISERALATNQGGVRLAFLRDPEGNVFEFVQS